jgi:hypothetical protein
VLCKRDGGDDDELMSRVSPGESLTRGDDDDDDDERVMCDDDDD